MEFPALKKQKQKIGVVINVCNPSVGEADLWGLLASQPQVIGKAQVPVRDRVEKQDGQCLRKKTPVVILAIRIVTSLPCMLSVLHNH